MSKGLWRTPRLMDRLSLLQTRAVLPSGLTVNIAFGDASHAKAMERLQLEAYQRYDIWTRWLIRRDMRHRNQACYIVATHQDELVGFIGARFNHAEGDVHVSNLAIAPAYQRQGIATLFMKELMRLAQQESMRQISLETPLHNTAAQQFYRRFGFDSVGVKEHYYIADGSAAVDMCYYFN